MKEDFLKYQAQTTPNPLAMEISHAKGSYIYDTRDMHILTLLQASLHVVWGIVILKSLRR